MGSIADLQKAINKKHGANSLIKMSGDSVQKVETIPTGSMAIDNALGGGIAKGRIIEVYGKESCLHKDTFIGYHVVDKSTGEIVNAKGGKISTLYGRFHKDKNKKYKKNRNDNVDMYVSSVNELGRIFKQKILDVVSTGTQECFKLTTIEGLEIQATANHQFRVEDGYYVRLEELNPGDLVAVHVNTPFENDGRRRGNLYENRPYLDVFLSPIHPHASLKEVRDRKSGKIYTYSRIRRSRAVMEAHMNGLSLEEYKDRFATGDIDDFVWLDPEMHVHHLDEDKKNDSISNLVVISPEEHGREHSLERHNNLRFTETFQEIDSIESTGDAETYDIKVAFPHNNFVANKFITHNSGKSMFASTVMKSAQGLGMECALIDSEHASDIAFMRDILEVDTDSLFVSQPNSGEEALDIALTIAENTENSLIVVDSVAALTPEAELAGDLTDAHVGLQARMMGKWLRKVTAIAHQNGVTLLMINQLRDTIGGFGFGPQQTTPGGRALKFYASQRLSMTRMKQLKQGEDVIGFQAKVTVDKNKVAPPSRKATIDILFHKGISNESAVIDAAILNKLIFKKGAWFTDENGESIGQGRNSVVEYLEENPDYMKDLVGKIRGH